MLFGTLQGVTVRARIVVSARDCAARTGQYVGETRAEGKARRVREIRSPALGMAMLRPKEVYQSTCEEKTIAGESLPSLRGQLTENVRNG